MGKITRKQTQLHDEAMALINLDRELTMKEIEMVFRQYNPMAEHNVGKGAIFFTPVGVAWELAVFCQPKGHIIDLCAGIGVLSYTVLHHDYGGWTGRSPLRGDIKRLVAIENNPEFVEIGKRLLPEVEWYCSSVFDLDFLTSLGEFNCAISNPPYGNIPSKSRAKWLKVKGPAQWLVMEVALRMCYSGGMFIVPENDSDYSYRIEPLQPRGPVPSWTRNIMSNQYLDKKTSREKYLEPHFPGVTMTPASVDISGYDNEWQGVKPKVSIQNIDTCDVEWKTPYGFDDVLPKSKEAEQLIFNLGG